jgi:hypothetical protein
VVSRRPYETRWRASGVIGFTPTRPRRSSTGWQGATP